MISIGEESFIATNSFGFFAKYFIFAYKHINKTRSETMFKSKNTLVWTIILSIPIAITVYAVQYFMKKSSQDNEVNVEETVENVKEVVKSVFGTLMKLVEK